jgi:hypothetical protein
LSTENSGICSACGLPFDRPEIKPRHPGDKTKGSAKGLCRPCYNLAAKARYRADPEAVQRLRESSNRSHQKHKKVRNAAMTERNRKFRRDIIEELGGKCACCGETELIFLCLDHIKGGGRREYEKATGPLSVWRAAKREGLPRDKYRVLCWNCNSAIGMHGRCPHSDLKGPTFTDRPTSAHEHVFLLTKKPRYFYDAIAVQEQGVEPDRQRLDRIGGSTGHTVRHSEGSMIGASSTRNMRNVWHLGPQSFNQAHFATFPTTLVEPCIKAGTSEKGCCAACGAPYVRVTERVEPPAVADSTLDRYGNGTAGVHRNVGGQYQKWLDENPSQTIGWQPSCQCQAGNPIPCTILDPFGGAGTVGLVADRLGRNSILIELNEAYAKMARQRLIGDAPLFADVVTT